MKHRGKNKRSKRRSQEFNADIVMSQSLLAQGMVDDAQIYAERAHKSAPGSAESFNLLGTIHLAKGDEESARQAFEEALQIEG